MTAVFDETKHPRHPAGAAESRGGEFRPATELFAKAKAELAKQREAGVVGPHPGFPSGEFDPDGKVKFWPRQIAQGSVVGGTELGAAWKAWMDPKTGEELAFWFVNGMGAPHHLDMAKALGIERPKLDEVLVGPLRVSGYGDKTDTAWMVSYFANDLGVRKEELRRLESTGNKLHSMIMDSVEEIAKRHRRDIKDAGIMAEPPALAASALDFEVEALVAAEQKLRRQYEKVYRRAARRAAADYKAASKVVQAAGGVLPDEIVKAAALVESFLTLTRLARRELFHEILNALLIIYGLDLPAREAELKAVAEYARLLEQQVGVQAERLVAGVQDAAATVMRDSLEEGWSIPQTAKKLQEKIEGIAPWQATMLARTDLIALGNGASVQRAVTVNDPELQYKTWLATPDERTRIDHRHAHAQTVPLTQPFTVGGEQLLYPGDPSASDGNVINCRCTVIYSNSPLGPPGVRQIVMKGDLAVSAAGYGPVAAAAAWDESKHRRHPAGRPEGGEFAPKGMSVEEQQVAEYDRRRWVEKILPAGEFDPTGPIKFWPEKMGAYSGFRQNASYGPLWKAVLDNDGNELAFWFADVNGKPHHDDMIAALMRSDAWPELKDYTTHNVSGYGSQADLYFSPDSEILARLGDAMREVPRRHRRDIRDANEFLDENQKDHALAAAAWDESKHKRHPAGAPASKGGQFAPKYEHHYGAMIARDKDDNPVGYQAYRIQKQKSPHFGVKLPGERTIVGPIRTTVEEASMDARHAAERELESPFLGPVEPEEKFTRTKAGDRLAERLAEEHGPEGIKDLWADDPRDAVATALDLNNAPPQTTIERARDAVREESRRELRRKYPSGRVTVYRGGEGNANLESWSLDYSTALFFAKGDKSRVREQIVPISAVEAYLPAVARGKWRGYGEEEVLLRKGFAASAWDEAKHPRHPSGTEAGGEFREKGGGALTAETLQGLEIKRDIVSSLDQEVRDGWDYGDPRTYARNALVEMPLNPAPGNLLFTVRRDGVLIGVGNAYLTPDPGRPTRLGGGYAGAIKGGGLALFRQMVEYAAENDLAMTWTAGTDISQRLYERLGATRMPMTENAFTLTKEQVKEVAADLFAGARKKPKALAAAATDDWPEDWWMPGPPPVAAAAWDESKHKRHPKGTEQGGEFARKGDLRGARLLQEIDRQRAERAARANRTEPEYDPNLKGMWSPDADEYIFDPDDPYFAHPVWKAIWLDDGSWKYWITNRRGHPFHEAVQRRLGIGDRFRGFYSGSRVGVVESRIGGTKPPPEIEEVLRRNAGRYHAAAERATGQLAAAAWREEDHPRDPGGEEGGQFIEKGTTAEGEEPENRLDLKPEWDLQGEEPRKQTEKKVAKQAQQIADDIADFYGGDRKSIVRYEPDATAAWDTDARTLIPPSKESTGEQEIWFGQNVMEKGRDPYSGVLPYRQIAHEAIHANVSGQRFTHGFYHDYEEGASEILAINYWNKRGQRFDHRDAVRIDGRWTAPGAESLAHSVVYREQVADLMRRAASRVGWDRQKVVAEVLRVVRGDSNVKLRFRDSTDPEFKPPKGVGDDAVGMIRWLIDPDSVTAAAWDPTKHPRHPAGAPGSQGGEFAPAENAAGATVDWSEAEREFERWSEPMASYYTEAEGYPPGYFEKLREESWQAYEEWVNRELPKLQARLNGAQVDGIVITPQLNPQHDGDMDVALDPERAADSGPDFEVTLPAAEGGMPPGFTVWTYPEGANLRHQTDPDWFEQPEGVQVEEVLDITDTDFFPDGPDSDLAGDYARAVDAARAVPDEPGFVTIYRGMSDTEFDAWESGEQIPLGKWFAGIPTAQYARDDNAAPPNLYSFRIPRGMLMQTGEHEFQLKRKGRLRDGVIEPWDESEHPRAPKGTEQGGEFVEKLTAAIVDVISAAGFNPSQARAPKGDPQGGQWIDWVAVRTEQSEAARREREPAIEVKPDVADAAGDLLLELMDENTREASGGVKIPPEGYWKPEYRDARAEELKYRKAYFQRITERLAKRLENDADFNSLPGIFALEVGDESDRYVPFGTTLEKVQALHQGWADAQGSFVANALRDAVADEFGLAKPEAMLKKDRWRNNTYYTQMGPAYGHPGLRSFVRAVYEETQAELRRLKIEQLTLYRGDTTRQAAGLWPASSTSLRRATADEYAKGLSNHYGKPANGVVRRLVTPASNVWSLPWTGVGEPESEEVIVIGERDLREQPVRAAGWDESEHPRHPAGTEQGGEFAPKGELPLAGRRSVLDKLHPEADADVETLMEAARLIDDVLFYPVVPGERSLFIQSHARHEKNQGAYWRFNDTNKPDRITLSPDAINPISAMTHELGHYLDHLLGQTWTDPKFARWNEPREVWFDYSSMNAYGVLAPVLTAIKETEMYKGLADGAQGATFTYGGRHWAPGPGHVEYLVQPPELIARSFEQYIAAKHPGSKLAATARHAFSHLERTFPPEYPGYLKGQDLERVNAAWDRVLRERGLLKRDGFAAPPPLDPETEELARYREKKLKAAQTS